MATLNDVVVAKPTEAQGYLVAAQGMLAAARLLEQVHPVPVFALTLLCGHASEAALKALLAQSGISAKILSKAPYGHDILYLWKSAEGAGFALPCPHYIHASANKDDGAKSNLILNQVHEYWRPVKRGRRRT